MMDRTKTNCNDLTGEPVFEAFFTPRLPYNEPELATQTVMNACRLARRAEMVRECVSGRQLE